MTPLDSLIDEFSKRHQLQGLSADETGTYTLFIDDQLEVRCFVKFDLLHLVTVLDTLPTQQTQDWLQRTFNYAFMQMRNSTGALTINADGQVLLWTRFASNDLRLVEFEQALERYLNVLDEYQRFLSTAPSTTTASLNHSIYRP